MFIQQGLQLFDCSSGALGGAIGRIQQVVQLILQVGNIACGQAHSIIEPRGNNREGIIRPPGTIDPGTNCVANSLIERVLHPRSQLLSPCGQGHRRTYHGRQRTDCIRPGIQLCTEGFEAVAQPIQGRLSVGSAQVGGHVLGNTHGDFGQGSRKSRVNLRGDTLSALRSEIGGQWVLLFVGVQRDIRRGGPAGIEREHGLRKILRQHNCRVILP